MRKPIILLIVLLILIFNVGCQNTTESTSQTNPDTTLEQQPTEIPEETLLPTNEKDTEEPTSASAEEQGTGNWEFITNKRA